EAYILGGEDAPAIGGASYSATEIVRSPSEMPLAPENLKKEKTGWGFFGRKKQNDLRQEPRPVQAQPARAAAPRLAPEEQPAPPSGEDLFPEHNRDEQF